ncbi:TPA: DUF443 family protein [Staphylococcus aureus]|nr:DUF443 family protein [Staphylococcus aureus]HDP2069767.1 DUF443 family protein [Staphylococcus aureus]
MLCESKVINKNPKYRIIKYDSEYLMIDLASNWIVFFFPFINWLIPKTYVKITKNDYEKLNIVKPVKNKSIGWTIFAGIVLLGGTVRRNTYLFDFQLEELIVWSSCFIGFLEIIFFYCYLNKKLTLKIFNTNVVNKNRVVLIPTFKQGLLIVFAYFFLGSASIFTLTILLTTESQNIIIFLTWVIITMFFFLVNMASIGNKNVHVILRINE